MSNRVERLGKKGDSEGERTASKGQVTVFVILGIVILVVVVMAMTGISTITKVKLQQDANNAVNSYLESESINYYVYTCMDAAVTSAIDDLSLQGGAFYTYQGGPSNLSKPGAMYIPYNLSFTSTNGSTRTINFNVSYSILNSSYCAIVNLSVPDYPNVSNQFIAELYPLYEDKKNSACLYNYDDGYGLSGFAGFNNMSRLCFVGSENTLCIGSVCQASMRSPCIQTDSQIVEMNRSVEYLLRGQISRRLENCTNFSLFEVSQGDNITVFNKPVTRVILTTEGISVDIIYNFSVNLKNKQSVLVKHTFKYDSSLRIVRLHNYVMTLLKADSKDFNFNISKDYAGYPVRPELDEGIRNYYDSDHMSVEVIGFENDPACGPTCQYKYDHLLIVRDNASLIGNRSLTYVTALKNRIPALDFIHQTAANSYYDIIVSNNQTIIIDPWGYDPDDQRVWYTYNGWKEDYNEQCVFPTTPNTPILCTQSTPLPPIPPPHNWSKSDMYLQTQRKANYTTNTSDYGPHNVTVTLRDNSGLFDYQVVKILVFDLPVANITTIKIYNDIPDNVASIEDVLPLNGTASDTSAIGGGQITKYIWEIYKFTASGWVPVPYVDIMATPLTWVPNESKNVPLTLSAVELIKHMQDQINPLELTVSVKHNVTLIVESPIPLTNQVVQSIPVGVEINVAECAPHQNNSNKIFPYNAAGTDPFTANHTCCAGTLADWTTYKLRSTSDVCYQTNWYGEIELLRVKSNINELTRKTELTGYAYTLQGDIVAQNPPLGSYPNGGDYNDIYNLTFSRVCDNQRGNICAGPMAANYALLITCTSKGTNDETCSGPAGSIVENAPVPTECTKYATGSTFETTFYRVGAKGQCKYAEVCSTPGTKGYNNLTGHALCKGACDGNGGCTYGTACLCDINSQCGAQCDNTYNLEWTTNAGGSMCKNNCGPVTGASACLFALTQLPCPAGQSSCKGIDDYCYSGVTCTASSSSKTKGEKCIAGAVINRGGQSCCMYWSTPPPLPNPICSNVGTCNLHADCTNPTATCSATQGWI
jgi:hypothetical protein